MSSVKDNKIDKSGWKQALAAAREQLAQYKVRLSQLKGSIRVFEDKIRTGAPFP
jgi:hypothetical protein